MADEALRCLTSLIESIPGWIAELEEISSTTKSEQKAVLENKPVDPAETVARRPSECSSLYSQPTSPPQNANPTQSREQMPHTTPTDALRPLPRKRKTSIYSDRDSVPAKYRSRNAVAIYYDGNVQNRFEIVVRSIASQRNSLRKGKMSAKVDLLSRTGSSSSDTSTSTDEAVTNIRKLGYRSTRMGPGCKAKNDGTEVFDKTDALLEQAQAQCEKAAHQLLREGSCALEISSAKAHLRETQKVSEPSLLEVRKRFEKTAERRRRSEERRKAKQAEEEQEEKTIATWDHLTKTSPLIEIDIEADGSDGDDDSGGAEFTVKAMTVEAMYRTRSARIAAH